MLRRDRQIKSQIQQVVDACIFGASFWMAWALRSDPDISDLFNLTSIQSPPFDAFFWLYLVLIITGPIILDTQGYYDRPVLGPRRTSLWPLFKGCVVVTVALIMVLFFMRMADQLARAVAVLFGVLSFLMILIKEELLRLGMRSKFARAQFQRKFILVGTPAETEQMRKDLKDASDDSIVVLTKLDLNTQSIDELAELIHEHSVNGVLINANHSYFETVEKAIRICEKEGVEVWMLADFFKTQISHTVLDDFLGRPVLVFRSTPEASWQSVLKQLLDFFIALIFLVGIGSWLFPLVAIAIKLTSKGPILFRQQRSGLNGQPFTIFKFRTMITDAERRKAELAAKNEMSGPVFKMKNDPRVTSVGRWLRKFSIDELPQLFNVLRGEMSLVGPRPLPVDEVKRFDDFAHRRRLSVKPGLTCLWQISGRNEVTDFKDWVRLDLEYIDNWSFWLDMKILIRTIPIVLIGTGAR